MTAEKNENVNLVDFDPRSGQNPEKLDIANSLGNHTVNNLHIFSVVFVGFDRENINTQDFRQNISNPARSSTFFMYTVFFFWKSSHHGEILDLLSKILSKT